MPANQTNQALTEQSVSSDSHVVRTVPFQQASDFLTDVMASGSGLYLFTGPAGVGKTMVLNWCIENPPDNVELLLLELHRIDVDNLASHLNHALNVSQQSSADARSLALRYFLKLGTLRAKGRRLVIMIDHVQEIHANGAELIKALVQMKAENEPLVTIVICGDTALSALLNTSFRWGIQKLIRTSVTMDPLNQEQTADFIAAIGMPDAGKPIPFSPSAVRRIYSLTEGIPHRVKRLADSARRIARSVSASKASARMVQGAVSGNYQPLSKAVFGTTWRAGLAGVILLLAPLFLIQGNLPDWRIAEQPPVVEIQLPQVEQTETLTDATSSTDDSASDGSSLIIPGQTNQPAVTQDPVTVASTQVRGPSLTLTEDDINSNIAALPTSSMVASNSGLVESPEASNSTAKAGPAIAPKFNLEIPGQASPGSLASNVNPTRSAAVSGVSAQTPEFNTEIPDFNRTMESWFASFVDQINI